jgi:hypothetical protein
MRKLFHQTTKLKGEKMARINIDDSLFKEAGFFDLAIKLGSRRIALGAMVEAFILAQKHFLAESSDRLIPLSEWKREKISDEIIECGLAEVREKGIYVRGSKEQFSWLIQRSEAGKKGGLAKANKKELSLATVSDRQAEVNGSKPLTLSPSSSSSSSSFLIPQAHSLTQTHTQTKKLKNKNSCDFDFEKIYSEYPRKVGKAVGIDRLKKMIKTETDYQALNDAVQNYALECDLNGTEEKYIKHFSSFIGTVEKQTWREYSGVREKIVPKNKAELIQDHNLNSLNQVLSDWENESV